jgi:dTDP-glucose 4,6-dehydratase
LLIVQLICDILNKIIPATDGKPRRQLITYVSDRPGHDRRYAIDFTKLNTELGWSPRESFKPGRFDSTQIKIVIKVNYYEGKN